MYSCQFIMNSNIMKQGLEDNLPSFKTIIVGDGAVGKSTLIVHFLHGKFVPQALTVAVDYQYKKVEHKSTDFLIELWDTAGQQRFRTMIRNYFNLSKAACLVFDLSQQQSFDSIQIWLDEIGQRCGNQIPKLLLGNKSDLLSSSQLQEAIERKREKINKICEQYNCHFFAVSGKTGYNVNEAFSCLTKLVYDSYVAKNLRDNFSGIKLHQERKELNKKKPLCTKKPCC